MDILRTLYARDGRSIALGDGHRQRTVKKEIAGSCEAHARDEGCWRGAPGHVGDAAQHQPGLRDASVLDAGRGSDIGATQTKRRRYSSPGGALVNGSDHEPKELRRYVPRAECPAVVRPFSFLEEHHRS